LPIKDMYFCRISYTCTKSMLEFFLDFFSLHMMRCPLNCELMVVYNFEKIILKYATNCSRSFSIYALSLDVQSAPFFMLLRRWNRAAFRFCEESSPMADPGLQARARPRFHELFDAVGNV